MHIMMLKLTRHTAHRALRAVPGIVPLSLNMAQVHSYRLLWIAPDGVRCNSSREPSNVNASDASTFGFRDMRQYVHAESNP